MREIKFRGWEYNEGRFLSWEELQEGTVQDVFRVFEVSQFTGLRDKKGKEVYEGDILKSRHLVPCVIEWSFDRWTRKVMSPKGQRNYHFHLEADFNDAQDRLLGYEVIGNIWENPSLLEAK